jgi:arabinogalactan endo-1,4-beta-galactosidase
MCWRVFAFLTALSLTIVTTAVAASSASQSLPGTPVPPRFVGMDVTPPVFSNQVPGDEQLNRMVASGVESIRVAFNWAAAQPYKDWLKVPSDKVSDFESGAKGVPTDFTLTDQIVEAAARHGLTVLPTVLYAPPWDGAPNKHGFQTPKHTQPFADYLTTLIDRYGPNGVFWAHNRDVPKLPIRMWQIWNEENLPAYWPRPFVKKYVRLLKASHKAIKAADPGAKVVLGALTDYSWLDLGKIEKVPGARQSFDYIAVNNFTATVDHWLLIMRLVRRAADQAGDSRKPMLATELSWPSAKGKSDQHYDWDVTEAGQAKMISEVLPAIAAQRAKLNLAGFYYYNWMGIEYRNAPAFNFAGLLKLVRQSGKIQVKPALAAFKRGALALEHCRKKGAVATRCIH